MTTTTTTTATTTIRHERRRDGGSQGRGGGGRPTAGPHPPPHVIGNLQRFLPVVVAVFAKAAVANATIVVEYPYSGRPPDNEDGGVVWYASQPAAFGRPLEAAHEANLFLPPVGDGRYMDMETLCTIRRGRTRRRALRGAAAGGGAAGISSTAAATIDSATRTTNRKTTSTDTITTAADTNEEGGPQQTTNERRRNTAVHNPPDPLPIALLVSRGGCTFGEKARNAVSLNRQMQNQALELRQQMYEAEGLTGNADAAVLTMTSTQQQQQTGPNELLEIRYVLVADTEPDISVSFESGDELILMNISPTEKGGEEQEGAKDGGDDDDGNDIDVSLSFLSYNSGVDLRDKMDLWERKVERSRHATPAAAAEGGEEDGGGMPDQRNSINLDDIYARYAPEPYHLSPADFLIPPSRTDDASTQGWYYPITIDAASPHGLGDDEPSEGGQSGFTAWLRYLPLAAVLLVAIPLVRVRAGRVGTVGDEGERGGGDGRRRSIDHLRGARKLTSEEVMTLPEFEYRGDGGKGEEEQEGATGLGPVTSDVVSVAASPEDDEVEGGAEDRCRPTPKHRTSQTDSETDSEADVDDRTAAAAVTSSTSSCCTCCSICIDDFCQGERLRLLPDCGHAFHTKCILPWLTERSACCPLCKHSVMEDEKKEDLVVERGGGD